MAPVQIEPDQPWWRADPAGGWLLAVRVQPGASRTGVVGPTGPDGDQLRIRLSSPPVDGRANAELVRWLAKELGVRRSAVTLVRGETGRSKLVRVDSA